MSNQISCYCCQFSYCIVFKSRNDITSLCFPLDYVSCCFYKLGRRRKQIHFFTCCCVCDDDSVMHVLITSDTTAFFCCLRSIYWKYIFFYICVYIYRERWGNFKPTVSSARISVYKKHLEFGRSSIIQIVQCMCVQQRRKTFMQQILVIWPVIRGHVQLKSLKLLACECDNIRTYQLLNKFFSSVNSEM